MSTAAILSIAAGAVAVLLILIIAFKLQAFLALFVVSALTALALGIPLTDLVDTLLEGLGGTLATVALLVGFGAMLGRMLEVSGGAAVLANALLRVFGERRAPLALGVAALIFGFPIFFDAGLIIFLPLVFTVARRLGGSVLRYALPTAGAFAVMHAFVPPHPGPVAAAGLVGADLGLTLVFGLLIGVPTWLIASYAYGLRVGQRVVLPVPAIAGAGPGGDGADTGGEGDEQDPTGHGQGESPSLGTVLGVILLPMLLIFLNTGLSTLAESGVVDRGSALVSTAVLIGESSVALAIAVLVASVLLGLRRGMSGRRIESELTSCLAPVAAVILVTGAGGMFGGVLEQGGVGDALKGALTGLGIPVIVAAFVIAALIRVAVGSATVALTTAAAIVAPLVAGAGGLSTPDRALIVIAIAGGATVLSHVNDSGFWLVGRLLGMDVATTLRTWTVMETLIGTVAFVFAFSLSLVL